MIWVFYAFENTRFFSDKDNDIQKFEITFLPDPFINKKLIQINLKFIIYVSFSLISI